jgi:hypothetical protein
MDVPALPPAPGAGVGAFFLLLKNLRNLFHFMTLVEVGRVFKMPGFGQMFEISERST